ncbi:hypothetical protein GAMM_200029 [Gammaproteobacteria bacterium]
MTDVNKTLTILGLSVRELSALAGISISAIYNLQRNATPSKSQTYAKIIAAVHATINSRSFSEELKKKRKLLDVSILALSRLASISYNTMYKIDTNEIIPSIKTCCKIAVKLNMPMEKFIDWPAKRSDKN